VETAYAFASGGFFHMGLLALHTPDMPERASFRTSEARRETYYDEISFSVVTCAAPTGCSALRKSTCSAERRAHGPILDRVVGRPEGCVKPALPPARCTLRDRAWCSRGVPESGAAET
jgi:hypothetical protein